MLKYNKSFFVASVVLMLCLAMLGSLLMPSTSHADEADCNARGGKWTKVTNTGSTTSGSVPGYVCLGLPKSDDTTPISTKPINVQARTEEECAANTSGAGKWIEVTVGGVSGTVTGGICQIAPGTPANCVDQWCVDGNTDDDDDDTSQTPASEITDPDECNSTEGYSWEADENQENGGTCVEKEEKTCGTEVEGTGWIICPGLNTASKFADAMWHLFEMLLNTNPLSDSIKAVWVNFRNIANALLILIFLIIVFSQTSNLAVVDHQRREVEPDLRRPEDHRRRLESKGHDPSGRRCVRSEADSRRGVCGPGDKQRRSQDDAGFRRTADQDGRVLGIVRR